MRATAKPIISPIRVRPHVSLVALANRKVTSRILIHAMDGFEIAFPGTTRLCLGLTVVLRAVTGQLRRLLCANMVVMTADAGSSNWPLNWFPKSVRSCSSCIEARDGSTPVKRLACNVKSLRCGGT